VAVRCRGFGRSSPRVFQPLPLPKADPDVFTVALVPLDNDENGQMEHDLVEGLREVQGIDVRVFRRPPISDANLKAGHELARKYLRQSGVQILLWGTVITASGKEVPKLYWTTSEATDPAKTSGRYPLTEDNLNLPAIFISDLAQVLRLLVATQSAEFYADEGQFVAGRLAPFIGKVRRLRAQPRDKDGARKI
jgi:hypothetical protein